MDFNLTTLFLKEKLDIPDTNLNPDIEINPSDLFHISYTKEEGKLAKLNIELQATIAVLLKTFESEKNSNSSSTLAGDALIIDPLSII